MLIKILSVYLFLLTSFVIIGCNIDDIVDDINSDTEESPSASATVTPSPISTPIVENPVATGVENFKDGAGKNLWKPVSDTTGNLVVVLHAKYKKEFSGGCFVERKDGKQEKLFCGGVYKCFGNPDSIGERLHMRSNIKCNQAKEVKVVCREAKQEVTFTVDEKLRSQVCVRHD